MLNIELINKIKNSKYFLEIYCLTIVLIIFLARFYDNQTIYTFFFITCTITLFLFNDFKYSIPIMIYASISGLKGFSDNGISLVFIFSVISFVIMYILYILKNKIKPKIKVQGWIFLSIAISTIIPIIWYTPVDTLNESTKMMYFIPIGYFIAYILTTTSKDKIFPILVKAMCYLPLLLMCQCMYYVLTTEGFQIGDGVLLGWGGGNHSSMLLCVALPFIIYRFFVEKNKILPIILGIFAVIALIFTNSRGGYLFFGLEVVLFGLYWLYTNRKKKKTYIELAFAIIVGAVTLSILFVTLDLKDTIFGLGLSGNGRFEIYKKGWLLFIDNPRNFIFGRGLINDYLWSGKVLFYHNNIIQFLVTGGIILFGIMIYHYIKKYSMLLKNRNILTITMLIGFIVVDLYGLTDSTYFTYYYMFITAIMYGCLDNELESLNELHNKEELIDLTILRN